MNSMNVGRVYSTTMNQPSGITEVLLEKAQREQNNLRQEVERLKTMSVCELGAHNDSVRDYMEHWECRALTAERERDEARKENEEQARLLGKGSEREARLITERDHYKSSLEEISTSIEDWLNSLIQELSLDFIHAIKAYAQKKLNEI